MLQAVGWGLAQQPWRACITRPLHCALPFLALALTGCSTIQHAVEDGRRVDEKLLAKIRSDGQGERALLPALVRTAALDDPDCELQSELPFSVATACRWKPDDRVAWVRGLGVDERLTVVGAALDLMRSPQSSQ